jgi:hypothetical protein
MFGSFFSAIFDPLFEVGHFIGVFVTDITDIAMWRSLGWIALGAVLVIIGIIMWLKQSDLLPDVMPVPV